jgi:ABC-type dipeptide/oligopeptide/nickel transport system permease subunit
VIKYLGWIVVIILLILGIVLFLPLLILVIAVAFIFGLFRRSFFQTWNVHISRGTQTLKTKVENSKPSKLRKPGARDSVVVEADVKEL